MRLEYAQKNAIKSVALIEYPEESVYYRTQSVVTPSPVRTTGRVTSSVPERFTGRDLSNSESAAWKKEAFLKS